MEIQQYLEIALKVGASDVYLSSGAPPSAKINGKIHLLNDKPLPLGETKILAQALMDAESWHKFEQTHEMNLAITSAGNGRFRVNVFQQRGEVAIVIRNIQTIIPTLDELGLPPILKELIMSKKGLILIVGPTSSGKSTTLASMIEYRNQTNASHIITIEDPIEFLHVHKKSIINQREIGIDTLSYEEGLKNALRQAPDVVLLGEVRSKDTMEYALTLAQTGHLCLTTLHAFNASQTLDRVINFFPKQEHPQLLLDLSLSLVAIISQRLIPNVEGKLSVATEVLLSSPLVKDLILKGDITSLPEVMEKSEKLGMHTFDMALFNLYSQKKISEEEALKNADSANNLRLKIALVKGADPSAGSNLSIKEE